MSDQPNPPDLNVTDSVPTGLKVTTDTPFRLLYVGSFCGLGENAGVSGPLDEGVVEVNPDNFNQLLAQSAPHVTFKTIDPVAAGSSMVEVSLKFDSLRAFDPKNLVEQLTATKPLADARKAIVERMHGKKTADEATGAVERIAAAGSEYAWLKESIHWTPAAKSADPSAVDSLLGQIDVDGAGDDKGASDAPPPKSPIGSLVSKAASQGSAVPAEEASALRRTLGEIDRRMSSWLTTVLHAPEVQSLESIWRSLSFLVSKTNFRKGIRLCALHAPGDMLERFRARLIDPVFDEGADAPDVIVVDAQYSNTATDLEALDEWAQHGASLPAVVLAGVGPGFFGVKHTWQMATLPPVGNMFDQWQFAKWKTLRGEPYARSLGVLFGRGLLRAPYERSGAGDLEFHYKEEAVGEKDFLWGNGAMAAGVTIVQSVAESGWPTAMAGFVHGRVEGFATATGGKKGDKQFGPTDTQMPQDKIEELAAAGISAAIGVRDHNDAIVWNGLTAGKPVRMEPNAFLEVSLPYQLFAARLSALLFLLKPHLSGKSGEGVERLVRTHVAEWLRGEGQLAAEQLQVQTRPAEDAPGSLELAVTVTPPQEILPGGIPVVVGYRL